MESYPRGLILEESDGDVAKVGVQNNALSTVGVAARLRSTGRPRGGLGVGAGGRSILVLVLAEHRLDLVHCVCWFDGFGVLEKLLSDDVKGREGNGSLQCNRLLWELSPRGAARAAWRHFTPACPAKFGTSLSCACLGWPGRSGRYSHVTGMSQVMHTLDIPDQDRYSMPSQDAIL